jgi:Raf kinase inhibitor-like YbhB/YbcL family protein
LWRVIATIGMVVAVALTFSTNVDAARMHKKKMTVPHLRVTSADIKRRGTIGEAQVANTFGCKGGNVSPEIKWAPGPAGTKSYAVTIYDPDAPTGSGFWHWVVFNIPATLTELPKNAGDLKANLAPAGTMQSRKDFGVPGYGGPCPPPGDKPHRYHITVFAVDIDHLDGDANISAAVVGFQLHFHTLAKGTITGLYGRSK